MIKNIRICERCFIISGWNDGFIKRDSNGTWFTDYYRGAFHAVENLMEEWKSIKSMATNLGSNKYQPDELLHRLLKKIDENKKEQKTIVQDFAQRESGKLKKDKAKKIEIGFSVGDDTNTISLNYWNNGKPLPLTFKKAKKPGEKQTDSPGSGLGLYNIEKMVHAHKAKWEELSKSSSHNVHFIFTFPRGVVNYETE